MMGRERVPQCDDKFLSDTNRSWRLSAEDDMALDAEGDVALDVVSSSVLFVASVGWRALL